jgi:hypothetical protein
MSSLSRHVPFALGGAIAFALACGGKNSTGPSASSVTGIAGDSQVSPTGVELPVPLSFVVLGSSGQPLAGVKVTWTVTPAGAVSFAAATVTTDAQGAVSTTVTLGGTTGDLVIKGSMAGVPPVVFHVLALNPCNYFVSYTLGTTVNGALAATDCADRPFFTDYYRLDLPSGQQSISIGMTSTAFDAWIDLYHLVGTTGEYTAFDDDIVAGTNQNSQLDIVLPGGSYIIGPSSYDARVVGAYSMTANTRAATMNGCRQVWVMRGVTITDAISTTDCADTVAGTDYYDVARIFLLAGTVLTIAERSTAVNAKLSLYRLENDLITRTPVASNDDSAAGNPNSFIAYTVTTNGPYDVFIGTSGVGETGAYTFEVSASTTLAGSSPSRSSVPSLLSPFGSPRPSKGHRRA